MPDDPALPLEERVRRLTEENEALRAALFAAAPGQVVRAPEGQEAVFAAAEERVADYFAGFRADPSEARIEVAGERYLLVRAAGLSYGFLNTVASLYADRGEAEALRIGREVLFDLAHALGLDDARAFHRRAGVEDPFVKLSAGPVHFAYTGWARVEFLPGSRPTPDEGFVLCYRHPFSFEADAWLRAGRRSERPVCIMNSGYSSGWCEESFGLPLTSVEVTCRARGDPDCAFVMAPPETIEARLAEHLASLPPEVRERAAPEIPTFFERMATEERLRRTLERAEAANRAKSELLASTSHELRTPLHGVIGTTELLLETALDDEQRGYAETTRQSARALLALVDDLLDFAQAEAGRLALSSTDFALEALVQGALETVSPRAREQGLTLERELDPALPAVLRGDSTRLRQVLLNLLDNAIKFTDRGAVRVTVAADGRRPDGAVFVRIAVRDTGVGVAAADRERIFESFVQADGSATRRHGGTGLGLAIVKRLGELMGGDVGLESEVGRGSTFWVRLPLQPAPLGPGEAPRGAPARRTPGRPLRVLVAEDNPVNRRVAEATLATAGHAVVAVTDGAEALEAHAGGEFDLVLMDLEMPVMSGVEAAARIRAQEGEGGRRRTPIVALTAHAVEGFEAECRAAGMDGYLTKPVEPGRLRHLVEELTATPG